MQGLAAVCTRLLHLQLQAKVEHLPLMISQRCYPPTINGEIGTFLNSSLSMSLGCYYPTYALVVARRFPFIADKKGSFSEQTVLTSNQLQPLYSPRSDYLGAPAVLPKTSVCCT